MTSELRSKLRFWNVHISENIEKIAYLAYAENNSATRESLSETVKKYY